MTSIRRSLLHPGGVTARLASETSYTEELSFAPRPLIGLLQPSRAITGGNKPRYWAIALAVLEKAVLELEPIRRMVPTTRTRITASTTAFFPPGVWAELKRGWVNFRHPHRLAPQVVEDHFL